MTFSPKSSEKKKKKVKKDKELERVNGEMAVLEARVARQNQDLRETETQCMRLTEANAQLKEKCSVAEKMVSLKEKELRSKSVDVVLQPSKSPDKKAEKLE